MQLLRLIKKILPTSLVVPCLLFADPIGDIVEQTGKGALTRNNEEFERILRNPYKKYLDEVRETYDWLVSDVYDSRDFAEEMKIEAKSIILAAGIATSVMVTLILLLLIFKAENSLRRQANSSERKPINKE